MKINIPTKITIARIVLIFGMIIAWIVCWAINLATGWTAPEIGNSGINVAYLIYCIVFIVAALTDSLDGYLARKWKQVTDLGKFLDPIADKMLVNSTLIFLAIPCAYAENQMAEVQVGIIGFCVIFMVLRDLVVDTMRFVAASKGMVVAANIFGKLKTIFQMIAIPFILLNGWPFIYFDEFWGYGRIALIMLYIATLMSIISGVIYVYQNRKVFLDTKPKEDPAKKLILLLKDKGLSLGSCESMTAGMFASNICNVSGASEVFKGSLVTYDPALKTSLADVDKALIDEKGIVSIEVAEAMAKGAADTLGVDICVSVTGNAGPSAQKDSEVGDVAIGLYVKGEISSSMLNFKGDRASIRKQAAEKMLSIILEKMEHLA